MDHWDDLLLSGGFAPRARLLHGLTAEEVAARPHGAPHSIYQELWHAATAQAFVVHRGRAALARWPLAEHFPDAAAPAGPAEWDALVASFLADAGQAVRLAGDGAWLASPEPEWPDSTQREALEFLAVHTAYHMGRIVLLRQLLGCWPPARE